LLVVAAAWAAACGSDDDDKAPDPVIPGAVPVTDIGFLVPDEAARAR